MVSTVPSVGLTVPWWRPFLAHSGPSSCSRVLSLGMEPRPREAGLREARLQWLQSPKHDRLRSKYLVIFFQGPND